MSSDLQGVNSDELASARTELSQYNEAINDKFKEVKNSIDKLSDSWKGKASDAVIKNFYDKLVKNADNRYTKQNNVINLLNTVKQGYEATEKGNSSLPDRFKN